MDLSKFRETTRVDNKKAGFLRRELTRLKYWFLPPTNDKRKERYGQYKDFTIFLGAALAVAFFEEKIKFLL